MNYDFLTDAELLRRIHVETHKERLIHILAERLEMRLRDIADLRDEVSRLEDELENPDFGE